MSTLKRAAGARVNPSPALGRETSSSLREEGEERATASSRLGEGGMGSNRRPGAFGFPGQPFSGTSWVGVDWEPAGRACGRPGAVAPGRRGWGRAAALYFPFAASSTTA